MSRRARQINDLKRNRAKQASYDRVLIVCEGSKTEPNYFREIIDHLKLNTANVEVDGSSDSSPRSVVAHAIQRLQDDPDFDRVYCFFDKDEHTTYNEAVQRILAYSKSPLYAILSVPCFEYWFLLHFEFTARPYARSGKRSPADCVIGDLKRYLAAYEKGDKRLFQALRDKLELAIERSKRVHEQATKNQSDNPSTQVHLLVEYLQNLKK